ncbi:OFA family MFS transporter [Fimbriiglobus ruber]|uniref:Major facilitator superfamily MFS_1 n=1 Tax=Fimbriiglobus ruber TaxID=1908690 RepID=A0A225DG90_9BACT|nr:OFA family MFS transporter [Fimbriiglobus ruber]OWK36189.1 major facilitator superfamily MFS_1 [Fimbriiglobus ruber]
MSLLSVLDRRRTIAAPGFNRWLVPPAALAIHLAIGQVYAFSVFKLPLTRVIGVDAPAPGDWSQPTLAWIFSIAIVVLGLSAALFGTWLERVGPRRAMLAAAACFGGGFLVAAAGVSLHQIWLVYLGYGVLGGIGLGLGYISPVSTLIKWFPDRPGMATGLAIMGFGGGAMIGSPLANALMEYYKSPTSVGVAETFLTMGGIYFVFMLYGAVNVRLPAPGWKPAGYVPSTHTTRLVTSAHVLADQAIKTPQFYLLWAVLFLNVTAGIGILEQASPMIQDLFPGAVTAAAAAGFVGLLSLFNMGGRFLWSSCSDYLGRKPTYAIYFLLGGSLYALLPTAGGSGHPVAFIAACAVIMSMYGGGFATIPAYLRDLFGTAQVGAIHGRLLTAWSCAGVAGPVLVNELREYQVHNGAPTADVYNLTLYIMAGLLGLGAICNFLVRAVHERFHATSEQIKEANTESGVQAADKSAGSVEVAIAPASGAAVRLVVGWLWVGVPLAWGVSQTLAKAAALFR